MQGEHRIKAVERRAQVVDPVGLHPVRCLRQVAFQPAVSACSRLIVTVPSGPPRADDSAGYGGCRTRTIPRTWPW